MSIYKNILKDKDNHIKTLRIVIVGLFFVIAVLAVGWGNAPSRLQIHIPPDLKAGSQRPWWEIPPANVYGFSFYIFQQLNRWPTDGKEDYKRNISALRAYLTPSCQDYLERDYKERDSYGELTKRVRGVYEIPGRGFSQDRVQVLSQDDWIVNLDLSTDEYYGDEAVKRSLVRYPLHVVRYDVDLEANPWGLALNCYSETPKRLERATEELTK
ncbi:PFL_4703 family integrating conjugative element protein [Testudinibacter sp. P80/BLE/0925]|uniref:PFL_4703 family integrating conjugative element protein n=1 Tax=Testudinibacter sp. TW-1 TaxID=3417757 RepID=UPI003D36842F